MRQDYERVFLDHKKALTSARKKVDTSNDAVFGAGGLRDRLAHNHAVNPPRDARLEQIARDNAKLVAKLTEISFKTHSTTTNQILERNKRVVRRDGGNGGNGVSSLNEHVRAVERARIEQANLGLAQRLLANNRSEYAPHRFAAHVKQHEYLVKNKSRLRAIQMKSSTPGQGLLAATARTAPRRASTADVAHRNKAAETQAADEYAGALRAYVSQQASLGYGLPPLPPIPGTSDAELLGAEDAWTDAHQSDLHLQRQRNTHAPKVRQSYGMNPREALHAPPSRHYHHADTPRDDAARRAQHLAQAVQSLEDELVVPRTRIDANTGTYEVTWVDAKQSRPDDTNYAASSGFDPQQQQQAAAAAAWQYHHQNMYAAFVAQTARHPHSHDESKESSTLPNPFAFLPHPPPPPPLHHPDGTPIVQPVWPFGGNILPPHLLPPGQAPFDADLAAAAASSPRPRAHSSTQSPRAKKSASKARGRVGRQIFRLRKSPHDAHTAYEDATSSRVPRAPNAAPASQPQRWQSHAHHVETIEQFADAAGEDENEDDDEHDQEEDQDDAIHAASAASAIPTIAAALFTPEDGANDRRAHKPAIAPPPPSHADSATAPAIRSRPSSSRRPLVDQDATVAEKVSAFDAASRDSHAPHPPHSSLHALPLGIVSPAVADRLAQRAAAGDAAAPAASVASNTAAAAPSTFVPTSKFSDAHPFSIAHSAPSTTSATHQQDTTTAHDAGDTAQTSSRDTESSSEPADV